MKLANRIQRLRPYLRPRRSKHTLKTPTIHPSCSLTAADSFDSSFYEEEESAEELAGAYLTHLRQRFQGHLQLLTSAEEDSSLHWANYWIQEETAFIKHHEQLLGMKSGGSAHFQKSYLRWRKERVLDFLWRLCRDESNMTLEQVEQMFGSFVDREAALLRLHVVNYICYSIAAPAC